MRQLGFAGQSQLKESGVTRTVPIETSESLVPSDTVVCIKDVQGCKQGQYYAVLSSHTEGPNRDLMHDKVVSVKEDNILSCFEKCVGRVGEDVLFRGLYLIAPVDGENYKRGQRFQVIRPDSMCKITLQSEPYGTGTRGSILIPKSEVAAHFRCN